MHSIISMLHFVTVIVIIMYVQYILYYGNVYKDMYVKSLHIISL